MQAEYRCAVLKIGDEVFIRGKIVQHFDNDVMVQIAAPRGASILPVLSRDVFHFTSLDSVNRAPRDPASRSSDGT